MVCHTSELHYLYLYQLLITHLTDVFFKKTAQDQDIPLLMETSKSLQRYSFLSCSPSSEKNDYLCCRRRNFTVKIRSCFYHSTSLSLLLHLCTFLLFFRFLQTSFMYSYSCLQLVDRITFVDVCVDVIFYLSCFSVTGFFATLWVTEVDL